MSRSFAASQHDRVQRRRINQTAPAPRVYYTVCSYRPTLASAQASASLRERMDAVSASAAATGAVATAAAELVALLRGAVPGAPISRRTLRSMRAFVRIAHTGRMRYVAHRGWPAVDSRGTWGRSAVPSSGVGVGVGVAPHLRPSASR